MNAISSESMRAALRIASDRSKDMASLSSEAKAARERVRGTDSDILLSAFSIIEKHLASLACEVGIAAASHVMGHITPVLFSIATALEIEGVAEVEN